MLIEAIAEHLGEMADFSSKTLVYMSRGFDPKEPNDILSGLGNICFKQMQRPVFGDDAEQNEGEMP
jgi:hypothetical protein